MQVVIENTMYQFHLAPSITRNELKEIVRVLRRILQDTHITKITFDGRHAAAYMYYQHGTEIKPMVDLQVSYDLAASH